MAIYNLRKKAAEDLEMIWLQTFYKWSENQAEAYLKEIFERLNFISENPNAGKKMPYIKKDFLYFPAGSHLIFYKIIRGKIEVYRILYKGMHIPKHLKK